MSALPQPTMTPAEYLAFERGKEAKHEYWNGQIYLMAGATARHKMPPPTSSASASFSWWTDSCILILKFNNG